MDFFHQNLAKGQWQNFSLAEQLGNIGSEIDRAIGWRQRKNSPQAERALARALELFNLTLADARWAGRRKELARAREAVCDLLVGKNSYQSSFNDLSRYFFQFALAARKNK